jgi:hypothetical protein
MRAGCTTCGSGRKLNLLVRLHAVTYERVHTVVDYFDGPREGLADYHGCPHSYKSEWNEAADDWAATFELTPVDAATFELEIERWEIWRTWERAFHSGQVPKESHPAVGGKNARYDELGKLIALRMSALKPLEERLVGAFRALQGQSLPGYMMRELEVEWTLPSNTSMK